MKARQPKAAPIVGLALSLLSSAAQEIPAISSLADNLPFDSNDRLSTHIFAFPQGECASLVQADEDIHDGIYGHKFVALEGQAFQDVFGEDAIIPVSPATTQDCQAVCLELGTMKSVVARPLPHRYWGEQEEKKSLFDFLLSDSCGKVEYGFVNYNDTVRSYFRIEIWVFSG